MPDQAGRLSEIKPRGEKEPIGGPRLPVLVLPLPPKVLRTERDPLVGIPDEICGGVLSAGTDRLSAPGRHGIPHLIVPGCVDMANFGPLSTVPEVHRNAGRLLYEWNPAVTLMRTNVEENRQMGHIFAQKANEAQGPVAFLLPTQGVSILDGDGERFCDREADAAFFQALRDEVRPDIPVVECAANINDAMFAEQAVKLIFKLLANTAGHKETS